MAAAVFVPAVVVAVATVPPTAVKSARVEVSAAEVERDVPPAAAPTCVQAG